MRHVFSLLVGLAVVVGLAGCSSGGSGGPTPSGTPSPSVMVSPSSSPTPDLDALYAEAERVVRRATQLEEQAIRQGPGSYPAELETLLADPYLTWSRVGVQQYWELGWTGAEGESAGLILRPQPGVSQDDSEVALEGCLHATSTVDANGSLVGVATLLYKTYFFKHVDGDLRLFTSTSGVEVEQCPVS